MVPGTNVIITCYLCCGCDLLLALLLLLPVALSELAVCARHSSMVIGDIRGLERGILMGCGLCVVYFKVLVRLGLKLLLVC